MANRYFIASGATANWNYPLSWSSTSGGTGGDVLGSELITNAADRDFSSDTGYWSKGSGWIISEGKATRSGATVSSNISNTTVLTVGKWYKITYTVLNYVQGTLQVVGFETFTSRSSNGTYVEYHKANNTLGGLRGVNDAAFSIDNISIQEVLTIPTSADNAIFDANSLSAPCNLTINAEANCLNLDFSGLDNLLTLTNAAYNLNVYGNLTLTSNAYLDTAFTGTGYLQLRATTSVNITSNGCTRGWNQIWLNGVGIFNFIDNFVTPAVLYPSLGTANFGSNTYSFSQIRKQTAGTTFTLNLDSSTVTTSQLWNDGGTFSLNAGTSSVIITSTLALSRTFYNLTLSGSVSVWFAGTVVQNTLTLTSTSGRAFIYSNYPGTSQTITCNGSIVASNVDFRDITLAGTANRDLSAITGGSGDCGGNSGITFTPAQTQYFKHSGTSTVNWSNTTNWFTTSGGSTQGRVPLPQDDAIFDANSFDANCTLNVNVLRIGNVDMRGVTEIISVTNTNSSNAINFFGSVYLSDTIQPVNYQLWDFNFHNDGFLDLREKTLNLRQHFSVRAGKTVKLLSNLAGNHTVFALGYYNRVDNLGTFDCNGFALKSPNLGFSISGGNCTVKLGSATHEVARFDVSVTCTLEAQSSIIKLVNPSSSYVGFGGISKAYNKVQFAGTGSGAYIVTGSNQYAEIIIEQGRKVNFQNGTTQTIGKIISNGTPSNKTTIQSTTEGSQATINYTGTGTPFIENVILKDINFTVPVYALNGTNLGNNTNVKYVWKVAKKTMGFPIRLVKDE